MFTGEKQWQPPVFSDCSAFCWVNDVWIFSTFWPLQLQKLKKMMWELSALVSQLCGLCSSSPAVNKKTKMLEWSDKYDTVWTNRCLQSWYDNINCHIANFFLSLLWLLEWVEGSSLLWMPQVVHWIRCIIHSYNAGVAPCCLSTNIQKVEVAMHWLKAPSWKRLM